MVEDRVVDEMEMLDVVMDIVVKILVQVTEEGEV